MTDKPDKQKIWHETLDSVKVSVSSAIFSTWISQTHLASLKKIDKKRYLAEIGCSSSFVKTTIEQRYFGLVQDSLIKTLGAPSDLTFTVKQDPTGPTQPPKPVPMFEDQNIKEEVIARATELRLRLGFTFDNFAVSPSNQMAWAAAEAVSRAPGTAYNPMFLWGGVGVGKTHLMHAVGYSLLKNNLNTKIVVCTGEEFTNEIIMAIRNKTTQGFRNKHRQVKALLIDDVQFIAGKIETQNEFFHTFNAVTANGGQVILTSDRPPSEIPKLEERIKSRFEAGLIVDIAEPDFELRCAIVQIKLNEKGIKLEDETLIHLIAGNIDSARKIEGFLIRLSSEVKLRNVPITEDLISNILGKGPREKMDKIRSSTPDNMIDAVCTHFSLGRRGILGKGRSKGVSRPRHILMYLIRTELNLPLEEVGRLVGGRDHSTVIHGVNKITKLASEDVKTREDILRIKNNI